MKIHFPAAIAVFLSLVAASPNTHPAESHAQREALELSPDLLMLIRAEMREITAGVAGVPLLLATADWNSIRETSEKIRASYIMENKLTPAQAGELEKALPEHFKRLDAEFHRRAGMLGAAAAAHDPELVAFHYYRLVESCAQCHSAFASQRFPGFAPATRMDHRH